MILLEMTFELMKSDRFFSFESGNGIQREEKGFLKNPTSKNPAQVMSGSWSYTGPDGKVILVTLKYFSHGTL